MSVSRKTGYNLQLDRVSYNPPSKSKKGVLQDVSFTVNSGEFVTIVGRNGHGKTSIIKAIAGELEEEFQTGEVKIGLQKIKGPAYKHANGVGIVHQFVQFDLIDHLSIFKNIQIRQLFSNDNIKRKRAVELNWRAALHEDLAMYIKENDFAPDLNTLVGKLSGGQRQLLNVLIAIKFEHSEEGCKLLLLDEHLTSLDVIIQQRVMNLVEGLTKDPENPQMRTATIVMVTHDFDYALNYSDRIFVIKDGRINCEVLKSDKRHWTKDFLIKTIE